VLCSVVVGCGGLRWVALCWVGLCVCCGVLWFGVVCYGVVWCDVGCCGVVRCAIDVL
jgi:hypothetical protein